MAKAEIHVALRGGEKDGDTAHYLPGEKVSGTAQVIPDGDVRCNHLYVRLQWHTEGRGDRDTEKIAEVDVFQGTLNAGVPSVHEFSFALPREPWSYAGHYVNVVWEIAVDVDVPWSVNPRHSQPFVMSPYR
jgi:hypothetical protein